MEAGLEERVEALEQVVAALQASSAATANPVAQSDWEQSIGMSEHDPGFDEMIRLGQRYRQRQPNDGDVQVDRPR